ncbi:MAG: Crp/Fnr family transcriptional regulator [Pseudomonadota bacterium]
MHATLEQTAPHKLARAAGKLSAIYLTETLSELNEGSGFLDRLSLSDIEDVKRVSVALALEPNETAFNQGEPHKGIYLIESGRVKTFYTGPTGKEITLAFWPAGHFVGGPEVFGGGNHMWSAVALEPSRLRYLPGTAIRALVERKPAFAVGLIEGLVAKGKCYSALVQMLGTRSAAERLAQLLLILAELHGKREGRSLIIEREITHDQLAHIIGSTRQWVTSTLTRFQRSGLVTIKRNAIIVHDPEELTCEF